MIPVVDLFAGPGGLGEGFCSYKENSVFKIVLSVEKEKFACETLLLRSFFHQFKKKPTEYYDYLKENIGKLELFSKFPKQYKAASDIVMNIEMGVGHNSLKVSKKIKELIPKDSHWVLLGGPPCQAYSVAGRSALKNLRGAKLFEEDKRHTLYKQYLRIISDNSPTVFIMENVKGLISSKINNKSTLDDILDDLSSPDRALKNKEKKEYNLFSLNQTTDLFKQDYVVDCSKHGVPQKRQRLFIVGIRNDFNIKNITSLRIENEVPVSKVLSNLPKIRSMISKEEDNHEKWLDIFNSFPIYKETESIVSEISKAKKIKKLGSRYIKKILKATPYKSEWFDDPYIEGVVNHETRKYLKNDINRYIYCSLFAKKNKRSPKISNFPRELLPNHKNIQRRDNKKIIFDDRFRVQLKDKPATTITSHISKDGHYYIHYDTSQARSLSVREAARIQTFPDNYFFEGNRTQQYVQVGNAVPPLMAKKIASIIYEDVIKIIK